MQNDYKLKVHCRYRAVTHPISYSQKSHDTRRVICIMIVIWVISLALASPIVLGKILFSYDQCLDDVHKGFDFIVPIHHLL